MRRVVWINQIAAIWLILFVVFMLGDSATAVMIASDGLVGLVLLLCSWRVLAERRAILGASWLQIVCGGWLLIAPALFQYPAASLPARNDVIVGSVVTLVGVIETW